MEQTAKTLEGYTIVNIKDIPIGEYFFTVNKNGKTGNTAYIRGKYDHSIKKYDCGIFSDISKNHYFKTGTPCTTDKTF